MTVTVTIADVVVSPIAVVPPVYASINHNLPTDADFFVVQFFRSINQPETVIVVRDTLRFLIAGIDTSATYKLLAFKISNGIADGVWWVDNYVYDPDQVNIVFKSSAENSQTGDPKSYSGTILVADLPAIRTVVAIALDADTPYLLASTQSDSNGAYTLNWNGYSGQMLVTVHDDYGIAHVSGEARGVGERIHPAVYTGYVYDVTITGTLGLEPTWPTEAGQTVLSGSCQLIAVPFYKPFSQGPYFV